MPHSSNLRFIAQIKAIRLNKSSKVTVSLSDSETLILLRMIIDLLSILRLYNMRNNPFNHPQSPIIHLYQKSKSKSQSNHMPVRNRSKSYR